MTTTQRQAQRRGKYGDLIGIAEEVVERARRGLRHTLKVRGNRDEERSEGSAPGGPTRMSSYDLRAILKEGALKWNSLRSEIDEFPSRYVFDKHKEAAEYILDLPFEDFIGLDLNGVNLSGAYLRGIKFTQCDLTAATFVGSYLLVAQFNASKLYNVNF
jgi:uncharacterized protein YjbI with pentapeptide repeats